MNITLGSLSWLFYVFDKAEMFFSKKNRLHIQRVKHFVNVGDKFRRVNNSGPPGICIYRIYPEPF